MTDLTKPIGTALKDIKIGDEITIILMKSGEVKSEFIEFNENGRQIMIEEMIKQELKK